MKKEYYHWHLPHLSGEYWQSVDLRQRVLREPLGMQLAGTQLAQETDMYHLGIFDKKINILGCLILQQKETETFQMKQVAVDTHLQGKGIGKKLVHFAEKFVQRQHAKKIILHARANAVPFYEKLSYQSKGNFFDEIGIPHILMEKIF